MMSLAMLSKVTALAVSLMACVTDVRSLRIPNVLTFGAAGAAILFQLFTAGPQAALLSVAGWLVGVLLFAPVFALGGLGAGDLKLLGAIGAGAVAGAFVLPRAKASVGPDGLVILGEIGTAVAMILFGLAREPWVAVLACLIAGLSWIGVLGRLSCNGCQFAPSLKETQIPVSVPA